MVFYGSWHVVGSVHTIQVVLFFDLKFSSCMVPDGAHLGFIEIKSEFMVNKPILFKQTLIGKKNWINYLLI